MKNNKKKIFSMIIFLLIIFCLGFGLTFAYLSLVSSAEKDSTKIYAGRIDVNYIQGNEVITNILYPISEPSFNTTSNVYRNKFGVSTEGTLEQTVAIDFKVNNNSFSNNTIKYAIYTSNGNKLATGYLNGSGTTTLADNIYFKENELKEFVLIIWLDENSLSQNTEEGKNLTGTIIINSRQIGF